MRYWRDSTKPEGIGPFNVCPRRMKNSARARRGFVTFLVSMCSIHFPCRGSERRRPNPRLIRRLDDGFPDLGEWILRCGRDFASRRVSGKPFCFRNFMNPPLHLFDCPPLFITLMRELTCRARSAIFLNERVWVSVIMPRGIISWISGGKSSSAKLRAIAVWLLPTRCAIASCVKL